MPATTASILANTVSSYTLILSGLTTLLFACTLKGQPKHWIVVYGFIVVTGIFTVWYHGFGENLIPGILDNSSNLILVWMVQIAFLVDRFPRRRVQQFALVSGILNIGFVVVRLYLNPRVPNLFAPIDLYLVGSFRISELLLVGNALFTGFLFSTGCSGLSSAAKFLFYIITTIFVSGMVFASAPNHRIDFNILPHHAIWHLFASFGFILLWGFNQARFSPELTAPQSRLKSDRLSKPEAVSDSIIS